MRLWTIGHSNRSLEAFVTLLQHYQLKAVADVRRFPGSRRQPQYSRASLSDSLAHYGLKYHWLPALGGHRQPLPDSPNTAWRNLSFRGYADYMDSDAFAAGLQELLELANAARTALMCAEALWWRCHRALIADTLLAGGIEVVHILEAQKAVVHPYTSPARIVDGRLCYAGRVDEG